MTRMTRLFLLVLTILALAACESTGDTEEDEAAAQSFFPRLITTLCKGLNPFRMLLLAH